MRLFLLTLWLCISSYAIAEDVLTSNGYQICHDGSGLQVSKFVAKYERYSRVLSYDIGVSSKTPQNVTALLKMQIYGQEIYHQSFSPCDESTTQSCLVSASNFPAHVNKTLSQDAANQIPIFAYTIPDLDGLVTLQIMQEGTNTSIACVQAQMVNGKTFQQLPLQYAGIAVAGLAFITTAIVAVSSAGDLNPYTSLVPSFATMIGWFQAMAVSGMLSVSYPPSYRSFVSNFGFSTGLVAWPSLERTIDRMRAATAGNLSADRYYSLGSAPLSPSDQYIGTGIQAYSEGLGIPPASIFVTLLLIFAMMVAGLIVLVSLVKIILEAWCLVRSLPKPLSSWRQQYWQPIAQGTMSLILIFVGVWTTFSIYQLTSGDSWLAKFLAGLTLGCFILLLAGLTTRIIYKARQSKTDGGINMLYEDDKTYSKYSLFYGSFRPSYWWMFIPLTFGECARGAIIAGTDGHGLVQAVGHLSIDLALLVLLLCTRPYKNTIANVVNIVIQIVRVFSIACIFVFVERFGISQTTKTIVGFTLIVTQAVLTGLLVILLIVNALIFCIRSRPAREKRTRLAKKDDLTELTAHNSLLIYEPPLNGRWKLPLRSPLFSPTSGDSRRGTYWKLAGHENVHQSPSIGREVSWYIHSPIQSSPLLLPVPAPKSRTASKRLDLQSMSFSEHGKYA